MKTQDDIMTETISKEDKLESITEFHENTIKNQNRLVNDSLIK